MSSVLFTNVRIFDRAGALPYSGEVLVQGNRISRISRGARQRMPTEEHILWCAHVAK